MRGLINLFAVSENVHVQFEIKNFFNKKNEFHFSGCSRTIQGAIKHFDLTAAAHSYNELLFIDDNSFIKVQTINFLYRINNKSIIGRIKSIVYTDSLDGGYLAEIISANVKGVIHKMETQLLDTSRYTEP